MTTATAQANPNIALAKYSQGTTHNLERKNPFARGA